MCWEWCGLSVRAVVWVPWPRSGRDGAWTQPPHGSLRSPRLCHAAALAALYEDSLDRWSRGGRDASNATRVSASENSAIERAVRTALLRRTHELDAFRPHLCFDIKPACSIAARAVCKRTKLTGEQYRVLLDPFAAAGVTVPGR